MNKRTIKISAEELELAVARRLARGEMSEAGGLLGLAREHGLDIVMTNVLARSVEESRAPENGSSPLKRRELPPPPPIVKDDYDGPFCKNGKKCFKISGKGHLQINWDASTHPTILWREHMEWLANEDNWRALKAFYEKNIDRFTVNPKKP